MEKRYKMKTKRRKRFTTSLVVRRMHLDSGTGLGDFIGRHNVVGGALCDKNIAQRFGQSWGSTEKFGGQIAVDLNRLEWSEMEELVFVVAFLVARQPRSALFEVQRLVVVLIAVVVRQQDGVIILVGLRVRCEVDFEGNP